MGGPRRVGWLSITMSALYLAGCATLPVPGEGASSAAAVFPVEVDEAAARRAIALYREKHGLGDVELDPGLVVVAQHQAEAMAQADVLSHDIAGDLPTRIKAAGLRRGAEAENVSTGYESFERALLGWEHSPRHNENLLYRPIRRIGIAAVAAPGTRTRTFWALVMTD